MLARIAVILTILTLVAWAALVASGHAEAASGPSKATGATSCQEDGPCWNWARMGDHRRGVRTVSGRRIIVNPSQFRTLYFNGRINLRGQRMRGDASALAFIDVRSY